MEVKFFSSPLSVVVSDSLPHVLAPNLPFSQSLLVQGKLQRTRSNSSSKTDK